MKKVLISALCGLTVWAFIACNPIVPEIPVDPKDTTTVDPVDTTVNPVDTIPTDTIINPVDTIPVDTIPVDTIVPEPPQLPESFPKKHLIEEFTGQDCGYCPYGMDCVHEFIGNDTNWVLILHHYGYQKDHFSVTGSQKITNKLGVNGAPTIAIDRKATKSDGGNTTCFHPGYLPTANTSQFATTTYASISIDNSFSGSDGMLNVHLSGWVVEPEHPNLMLTVLVKESGMIDYQQDYNGTYEGWQEFRHANAVRAFLTAPLGDSLHVQSDYSWSADYQLEFNSEWVPENCAVVAFITENFKPVVQAEQRPVVEGTEGGLDIVHGGITPVPVADYYPEPGEDISPSTYSGRDADTLIVANAYYYSYPDEGYNYWQIQAYNINKTVKVNNTSCIPFADLYLFTDIDTKTIPTGKYKLNTSMRPGSAYAGFRDDEQMLIDGSSFYYTSKSYFSQGYLVPQAQWLIVDGSLTVKKEGWEIVGHALNGTSIHLVGTQPISIKGRAGAPQRIKTNEAAAPQRAVRLL